MYVRSRATTVPKCFSYIHKQGDKYFPKYSNRLQDSLKTYFHENRKSEIFTKLGLSCYLCRKKSNNEGYNSCT